MLQQVVIPTTPEEIAARLARLDIENLCIVKGVIIGMEESMRSLTADIDPRK